MLGRQDFRIWGQRNFTTVKGLTSFKFTTKRLVNTLTDAQTLGESWGKPLITAKGWGGGESEGGVGGPTLVAQT